MSKKRVKDWGQALKKTLRQRTEAFERSIERCQKHCSEKAVHETRVEARRMLALLELLGGPVGRTRLEKSRQVLGRHLDSFDALRDVQVQLKELRAVRRRFPETKTFRESLREREGRGQKKALRRLGHLKIRSVHKTVRRLARHFSDMNGDGRRLYRSRLTILHAVRDAFARTLKLQRGLDPGDAETIHRTRIAFKKFRYMIEALQPLFPEITAARLQAMRKYQGMMGAIQDTQTLLVRLDHFIAQGKAHSKRLTRFRHWLLTRQSTQIADCMDHSDRLRDFWPLHKETTAAAAALQRPRRLASTARNRRSTKDHASPIMKAIR